MSRFRPIVIPDSDSTESRVLSRQPLLTCRGTVSSCFLQNALHDVAWTKDVICPLASKAQLRALDRLADRVVDLGKTLGKRHQHKAPSRLRLYAGRLKVRFWVPCIPPGDLLSDCYFCS